MVTALRGGKEGHVKFLVVCNVLTLMPAEARSDFARSLLSNGWIGSLSCHPLPLLDLKKMPTSNYIAYEKTPCLKLAGDHTCVSHQWLAHTFLSPLCLAYKLGAASESPTSEGVNYRLALLHRLAVWLMRQNTATITIIMTPAIALFGVLFIVESFPLKLVVTVVLLVLLHYKSRMRGMKFVDNRKKTSE